MDIAQKLEILADSAKYDVACTSSGADRRGAAGSLGAVSAAGCCHSFTPDGRCVTLLKVLMTNVCVYDCAYCVNRKSNLEAKRTSFTPRELADLTVEFYRRNYIEGLFLSSGVAGSPDATSERMVEALRILREEYRFRGYIHAKTIPGTSLELIDELGRLADRLSVNLELPSQQSLRILAPDKSKQGIFAPMLHIRDSIAEDAETQGLARKRTTYYLSKQAVRKTQAFSPAGQSTQMIIGATPESDYQILNLSSSLYQVMGLKRVFFSAYLPVAENPLLPSGDAVALDREHRLYQADWLLRFYGFSVEEVVDEAHPFLQTDIDPKANWALNNLDVFPIEVNTAPYETLLRVPGIGVRGAKLILKARRQSTLKEAELRKLGIAYKRARYFITMNGTYGGSGVEFSREAIYARLAAPIEGGRHGRRADKTTPGQMSLFESVENAALEERNANAKANSLASAFAAQRAAAALPNATAVRIRKNTVDAKQSDAHASTSAKERNRELRRAAASSAPQTPNAQPTLEEVGF